MASKVVITEMFEASKQVEEKRMKKPKRILHFSDGTLEEFSSDEDELDHQKEEINPQTLSWLPWMVHHTSTVGSKTLEVFDYMGESLASFFGITTPKYQFEINEFLRTVKAEEEAKKIQDLEMGGWIQKDDSEVIKNQYASDFSPMRLPPEPIIKPSNKTVPSEILNSQVKF